MKCIPQGKIDVIAVSCGYNTVYAGLALRIYDIINSDCPICNSSSMGSMDL